ncbi:MAG: hypothetical protein BWY83_02278 [bacterium ADurb.Bin478]|nr:MAG: hypothetical protein BWY83_02278 [bacterium ADurb.Bin478]
MNRTMYRNAFGVLLALASVSSAQSGSGLSALQIGSSSRATAMAEAATAVTRDAASPFWNPAGLAWLHQRQLHVTHNAWIQGVRHEALAVAASNRRWSWGVHALLTSVDDIEQRTIASEEPLSTFSSHTVALGITLARPLSEQLSLGMNLRWLYEKIYTESANGYSVDFGAQVQTPLSGLRLGATVQNLGSTSTLYREKLNLPETMRIGAGYTLPLAEGALRLLLAADYVQVFDKDGYVNAGVEIWPLAMLAMRAGYASNHSNRDLSMGFGLALNSLVMDYAYVPFKQGLGTTHQFSITFDL